MRLQATTRAGESRRRGAVAVRRAAGMDRTAEATHLMAAGRWAAGIRLMAAPAATALTGGRAMAVTGRGVDDRARRAAGTATRAINRWRCVSTFTRRRR